MDRPGVASADCLEDIIEALIHQVVGMDEDIHALVIRLGSLQRIPKREMERYLKMDTLLEGE